MKPFIIVTEFKEAQLDTADKLIAEALGIKTGKLTDDSIVQMSVSMLKSLMLEHTRYKVNIEPFT